jgi:hypothetical protein
MHINTRFLPHAQHPRNSHCAALVVISVVDEALLQVGAPGFNLHHGAVGEEGAHVGGVGGEVGRGGLGLCDVAGCWEGVDVRGDVVGGSVWGGREIIRSRVCDVGDRDGGEWNWV